MSREVCRAAANQSQRVSVPGLDFSFRWKETKREKEEGRGGGEEERREGEERRQEKENREPELPLLPKHLASGVRIQMWASHRARCVPCPVS